MWHRKIDDNPGVVLELVDYFNKELEEAKKEVDKRGLLVTVLQELPSYHELRFGQLQELESVLEIIEANIEKIKTEKYKLYCEGYQKVLSSTDIKRYVDGDPDVIDMIKIKAEVAYIRNKFFGIIKSFEMKHYALSNVTKIRVAGIEDSTI